ncbi:MAG: right-handed parallel beta-helix repeat-containing protein [Verrucomicrobiales bacterium]|nr:right-handed parallel beta-helix repeat-containing protein [Verrucomicrobiales bacterium]
MQGIVAAGLLSFFVPAPQKPRVAAPCWPQQWAQAERVTEGKERNFAGTIRVLGVMPQVVKEYGRPALHVQAGGVTVRNFAWRGSMEGVHVGSEPFNGRGMRQRHSAIRVTLDGLFCDDIGEDCVSIQPRAVVTLRNSTFRGNFRLKRGEGCNPGLDKILQIDGATVIVENCGFFNGRTAIRAKANSRVVVRNCWFVDCATCISGDGNANPRPVNPYDNGQAGPARVVVENCRFWDCREVARAFPGCEIELREVQLYRTWKLKREDGGIVRGAAQ